MAAAWTGRTLAKVFEPFFTTKAVGEGTGLGLPTVHWHRAAEWRLRGHPEHARARARTVCVYLPRYLGGEDPVVSESDGGEDASLPGGDETVLVVEDEAGILSVCGTVLGKLGYRVLLSRRPTEALRLVCLEESRIDLLVTDVVMPEMSGRELAREIARSHPGIPCLYVSGHPAEAIAHHGVLDEGVDFLPKPFSNADLALAVRRALDKARAVAVSQERGARSHRAARGRKRRGRGMFGGWKRPGQRPNARCALRGTAMNRPNACLAYTGVCLCASVGRSLLAVALPFAFWPSPGGGAYEGSARILDSAPTGIGVVTNRVFVHVNDHILLPHRLHARGAGRPQRPHALVPPRRSTSSWGANGMVRLPLAGAGLGRDALGAEGRCHSPCDSGRGAPRGRASRIPR